MELSTLALTSVTSPEADVRPRRSDVGYVLNRANFCCGVISKSPVKAHLSLGAIPGSQKSAIGRAVANIHAPTVLRSMS